MFESDRIIQNLALLWPNVLKNVLWGGLNIVCTLYLSTGRKHYAVLCIIFSIKGQKSTVLLSSVVLKM